MTSKATEPLLRRARDLVPQLRDQAIEAEQARRVPAATAKLLADAGLYRMLMPRALAGGEVSATSMVEILATLAEGDAASAWTVMTGATTSLLAAYLDPQLAMRLWGDSPETIMAGVFAPRGKAVASDGGYLLTGRWSFTSGCDNASWLLGGASVVQDDGPRRLADGRPEIRSLFFPASAARRIDSWDVMGLCGSGSHDIEVNELFVPAEHTTCIAIDRPRHDGVLYRFPIFGLLASGVAAVGLGIARAAIDALMSLAQGKRSFSGHKSLAEQEAVQLGVARAEAELGAARAFLLDRCRSAARQADSGELALAERALLRLAASHASRAAGQAVDRMYQLGGGAALYRTSPLQRHFRDIHTLMQHIMVAASTDKTVGRVLLGVDVDVSQL